MALEEPRRVRLGPKGQVMLPAPIRRYLRIKEHSLLLVDQFGEAVVLLPLEGSRVLEGARQFREAARKAKVTEKELLRAVDEEREVTLKEGR